MRLAIAKITKPHGIKGEVRVTVLLDSPELFCRVKSAYLEDMKVRISARNAGDAAIVRIQNVLTRDDAELLRGKTLYVDREDADRLKETEYFVDDLVGCSVVSEDGSPVGTLKAVHSRPAQDLYEIESEDGKSFLIPAVKEFVKEVNVPEKRIVIQIIEGLL